MKHPGVGKASGAEAGSCVAVAEAPRECEGCRSGLLLAGAAAGVAAVKERREVKLE